MGNCPKCGTTYKNRMCPNARCSDGAWQASQAKKVAAEKNSDCAKQSASIAAALKKRRR